MQGWVKIYRELLDKPIWQLSTPGQKVVLITILMLASHTDKQWEWQGKPFVIKPGQFITSLASLADKAGKGVTSEIVKKALKRFVKYGFIVDNGTKTGRLITIVNWGKYQDEIFDRPKRDQSKTKARPPIKNVKNVKNNSEVEKIPFAEIIDYLNNKTGKRYKNVTGNQKYIKARWHEGNRLDDFKHVIDVKAAEWLGTDWAKYLRPVTLFGNKFDEYLNQGVKPKSNQNNVDKQKAERLKQIQRFVLGQYIDGCKPEEIQQLVAERNANLSLAAINKIIKRGDA